MYSFEVLDILSSIFIVTGFLYEVLTLQNSEHALKKPDVIELDEVSYHRYLYHNMIELIWGEEFNRHKYLYYSIQLSITLLSNWTFFVCFAFILFHIRRPLGHNSTFKNSWNHSRFGLLTLSVPIVKLMTLVKCPRFYWFF